MAIDFCQAQTRGPYQYSGQLQFHDFTIPRSGRLRLSTRKRRAPVKSLISAVLLVAGICLSQGAAIPAQTATQSQASTADQKATAQDIELMRKDIRSMRKQLVAANLKLTDTEATKFWPIYDEYISELVKVNNTKYDLLKEYFNSYGQLTDEQADSMTTRLLKLEVSVAELRQKYQPIFRAAVPAKVAASFFQLDRRIAMMIDLQLGSQIPLVQE
jgi:uncharacterized membrane-anchored protein YhcB (DUF1043 family)